MSESHKKTAVKFLEALGGGDAATLKTIITDDIIVTTAGHANISGDRDYKVVMQLADAFPKITKGGIDFKILNLTAEENRVACEAEGTSTLVNDKAYNNVYHFLFFFRDGKVCRLKEYLDTKLADEVLGPFIGA